VADDRACGSGQPGGDRPAAAGLPGPGQPRPPAGALVLQLVIVDTEPLSGSLSLQQPNVRVDFSGWIGLMSAINELRAGKHGTSTDPMVK
jgi:hypothetical protein